MIIPPQEPGVGASAIGVNTIGSSAVPQASILPPLDIERKGVVPSFAAYTVTPGSIVKVAPEPTNTPPEIIQLPAAVIVRSASIVPVIWLYVSLPIVTSVYHVSVSGNSHEPSSFLASAS